MKTLTLLLLLFTAHLHLSGQTLIIEVSGLSEKNSNLVVGLFTSAKNFTKKSDFGFIQEVTDTTMRLVCKDILPLGQYALSIFQDENKNRKLDTEGIFSIPTEKYGFSNNAKGFMGPPSFKECAFVFEQDTTVYVLIEHY